MAKVAGMANGENRAKVANSAKDAVVTATLWTLRNWGAGFLIAGILMSRYLCGMGRSVSDSHFVFWGEALFAIVLFGLWFRWNRPFGEDRTVWRVCAILLMIPTADLVFCGSQVLAAGDSFKDILANQSLLIFFPFLFWGGRFVIGSVLLAMLWRRSPSEPTIAIAGGSLTKVARRAVRRLSVTVLLILLWVGGAILNLALLLVTTFQIRESILAGTPVDRTVWFQCLATLIPLILGVAATLGMGGLETSMMIFRRRQLHAWWSGRTFLWLSRGFVIVLMIPMLGDLLMFGAYFLYPIRVVVGIFVLFVIGRRDTYAAMGEVLAETLYPTSNGTPPTTGTEIEPVQR